MVKLVVGTIFLIAVVMILDCLTKNQWRDLVY